MTLSKVFRIFGGVLLIFAIIDRFVPIHAMDDLDLPLLTQRAVNIWVSKLFTKYFRQVTVPSEDDVAKGSILYDQKKEPNVDAVSKTGTIHDLPLDKLETLMNSWEKSNVISKETADNMRLIIKKPNFKEMVDYVHVRSNGDIIYSIYGFVESKKSGNRSGSILYAFHKFKLQANAGITFEKAATDDTRCTLWNQFCPTKFSINGLTDSESESLFDYIRSVTVGGFVEDNAEYFNYLDKESERYRRFLPASFTEDLTTMESNPDKLPTELFSNDPFTIDKY